MVLLLLSKGADPNISNKAGNSAMKLARNFKYSEIVKLFEAAGKKK